MADKKTKQTQLKERPNKLITKIIRSTNARSKKDIQQWRVALQAAENADNPKRTLLYNLYNEILLDAHLTAEINRRLNAILATKFELYDENGTAQPEASKLLRKKWFRQLIQYAWESILWGHSLIEIEDLNEDGTINSVRLINRLHVLPESGIVTEKQGDEKGIDFRQSPQYAPWLFEMGSSYDLGLLNKCVPHVIFKRFAQSAYSEYCEVLGIPPRVLKTAAYDTESLNKSEDMVAGMGSSHYAVIGKDDDIVFVQTPSSDGSIFTNLFKVSSSELSKLIGGAVIGEDSQNGSRSKEEVGLKLVQSSQNSDKAMLQDFITEKVLPRLVELGYPVDGLNFEFLEEKDTMEELEIALKIASQFEIADEGIEYINQTFGVPVTKQKEPQGFGGFGDAKNKMDVTAKKKDFFS